MEFKAQVIGDVSIGKLFHRQADVQTNRQATRISGAAIGGLHDARPTASADNELSRGIGESQRPFGHPTCQFTALVVVAGHGIGGEIGAFRTGNPGRSKEGYRVVDLVDSEFAQGVEIFGKYANASALRRLQELRLLVGEGVFRCSVRHGLGSFLREFSDAPRDRAECAPSRPT